MKFYFAQNAAHPIHGIQFEKYDIIGGTVCGVYKTESEFEIERLDSLIGKSSVIEISEADYESSLKKKRRDFADSSQLSQPLEQSQSPGVAIKGRGAVVVENSDPFSEPVSVPVTSVETAGDALVVASITAEIPVTIPAVEIKSRRGGSRQ